MKTNYKSWNDLSKNQQKALNECKDFRCGASSNKWLNKFFVLPQFCFRASCVAHDWSYSQGGGLFDFIKANNGFVKRMFIDIYNIDTGYVNKAFYHTMAILYYVAVSVFGLFNFS